MTDKETRSWEIPKHRWLRVPCFQLWRLARRTFTIAAAGLVKPRDRSTGGEGFYDTFRNRLILLARTAAYADGANHLARAHERDAACKDHHASVVGGVDPEELTARLRVFGELLGADVKGS